MPDVEIPKRALFKASEVCEIASVQPYVLRSWESEFPDLGVSKSAGAPRIYRRQDVERVLRIKQLVFAEGLTLAGVRRRIDDEAPPRLEEAEAPAIKELLGRNAKERLAAVKRGLISILDLLGGSIRPSNGNATMARAVAARTVDAVPAKSKSKPRPKPAAKARRRK